MYSLERFINYTGNKKLNQVLLMKQAFLVNKNKMYNYEDMCFR